MRLTDVKAFTYRHLNFFRCHLLYFSALVLVSALLIIAINGSERIGFVDSLLSTVGAATGGGMTTIVLSEWTVCQQLILFAVMLAGDSVSEECLAASSRS